MFGTFFESVEKDSFLTDLSARPGYAFLGNATPGVCLRQVRFIAEWFRQRTAKRLPRILEWGCGLGQNSYLLQRAGFDVVSADVAFACGEVSEKCGIPYFGLTDKTKLPFADGEFDAVTSFGVLEHVPDDLGSMREIHRVLNGTGTFFVFFLPYVLSWGSGWRTCEGTTITTASTPKASCATSQPPLISASKAFGTDNSSRRTVSVFRNLHRTPSR
jgi:SAM-dependent methyltransferase